MPNIYISLGVAKMTRQLGAYTKAKGLEYEALVKMTLQMAKDAGKDGFKRADLFVALEHSLPANKDTNSKKRYLGHLLDKLRSEGLLDYTNNCWFITEKGLKQM